MKNKLYIFFVRSIVNIGGAEIYTRNKFIDLKKREYDVLVFSTKRGCCYIEELKQFNGLIFQELANDPFLYTEKQRNKITDFILKKIGDVSLYEEVMIESQTVQLSVWGEIFAKKINASNFCFFPDDRFAQLFPSTADFLKYKLKRKELVGITPQSLCLLFRGNYDIQEHEKYNLRFYCSNSIEECNDFKLNIPNIENYDIIIGSITRLEKVCTPFIMDNMLEFAKENKDKKILFIFIGGSSKKKLEKFYKKKMSKQKNLDFILTGTMYPIPLQLVKQVDLFIGVSGAVGATTREGIPTMSIELETGKPLGIFKYNTNSNQYKDCSVEYISSNIKTMLNEIFIENKYCLDEIRKSLVIDKYVLDFSTHHVFMHDSKNKSNAQYFDFSNYMISKKWKFLVSFIYGTFGSYILTVLMDYYRKLNGR